MIIMIIVLVLALSKTVLGTGTCELDKDENYHPGETALFFCSCTIGNEQNQAGYIVFKNSSGLILQNNSVNSGTCMNSVFSDTYLFPEGISNYTGNVTFSLFGDGSGTPTNWGGAGDVTVDYWNVSDAGVLDCEITNINPGNGVKLGQLNAGKATIIDGITGDPIVNARCQTDIYDIDGNPIVFEPYGAGETARLSGSSGEVGFQHFFDEKFFTINTNYLFEFHCYCPNGNNSVEIPCYDEVTGLEINFHSCTTKRVFSTTGVDERNVNKPFMPVVWVIVFTSIFFLVTGFLTPKIGFKIAGIGIGIIELVILAFVVWINRDGNSIISILRMNFYILLILGFGIGFIGLIFFVVRMMNPKDRLTEEKEDKKWSK